MTIESTPTAVRYAGGGPNLEYDVPFPVIDKSDIQVDAWDGNGDPAAFAPGTDYALDAVGIAESLIGSAALLNAATRYRLSLSAPLPEGWTLEIRREVPITQDTMFRNQGSYSPHAIERCLDKLTMICQELRRDGGMLSEDIAAVGQRVDAESDALTSAVRAIDADNGAIRRELDRVETKLAALAVAGKSVSPTQYRRSGRFSSEPDALLLPEYMEIMIGGSLVVPSAARITLSNPAVWDDAGLAVPANRAGRDVYVYAAPDAGGGIGPFILSANATVPSGSRFNAGNTRKIGGFHCLCADVGTIEGHALSGMTAGRILPASVWDLRHRPIANPEGMAYCEQTGKWYQIYLTGMDGGSAFGAAFASHGAGSAIGTHPIGSYYWFVELLSSRKMRLLTDDEFQVVSRNSPSNTVVHPTKRPAAAGGHVDTSGRRIVSDIGLEDCCGVVWQWLADNASFAASDVASSVLTYRSNYGASYGMNKSACAGGSWGDPNFAGVIGRRADYKRQDMHSHLGGRGCSLPLASF